MSSSRKYLVIFLAAFLLFGCAAERIHKEGIELVDKGQLEAGLDKLQEASKSDPENLKYRTDLIQQRDRVVQALLINAHTERQNGNLDQAAALYQRILKIDAENPRAKAGLAALLMDARHTQDLKKAQELLDKHDMEEAQNIVRTILLENPDNTDAHAMQRKIDELIAKAAAAGPSLSSEYKKPVSLQFRDANLKMVIEAISRSNSINILLDKDVKQDLKTTIFVKDAPLEDTLDLILMQNQLEKKILSENTVFVYPNNPAKLKEYQDLKIRTFQLTNADAKEMQTMLKTLLKTKDLFVDEKNNSLVMRDTPDAIRLAEKLITAQDTAEPEVMLEVEVLEVTRSHLTELGLKLPQQIGLSAAGVPQTTHTVASAGGGYTTDVIPAQPLTLSNLGRLNGTLVNVSPLSGSVDLRSETGDTNILASPRIRVRNREKAKIMIGDRVPVITSAQTPVAGGSAVSTTNVQYLDVGLKLDVEPNIHLDDDVAIKVNLEVSNIVREISTGQTVAYQIGTRTANTVLRLKDGETQVLAGLISDEDRKAAQKLPGLGDLPILGRLFSSHKDDNKKTEIVLSITPHLTRASKRADASNLEFWSGTDNNLRSTPISVKPDTMHKSGKHKAEHREPESIAPPNANGAPTGAPVLLNLQGPSQIKVGEEFKVIVGAESVQPLGTFSFLLDFDPALMSFVKIDEGDLLRQNGKKTIFTNRVEAKPGHLFAQVSRLGKEGATGKGSIATITFKSLAAKQQIPLNVSTVLPVNADGRTLPFTPPAPLVTSAVAAQP